MIAHVHGLRADLPGDVALADDRVRAATMGAENLLHDLGLIPVTSSDAQGMGRAGETVAQHVRAGRRAAATTRTPRRRRQRAGAALPRQAHHQPGAGARPRPRGRRLEPGKLADIVLWRPELFGAKPELVLKSGFPAWGVTGDPNAAIDGAQPLVLGPQFGGHGPTAAELSLLFVTPRARRPAARQVPTRKRRSVVTGTRTIGAADMVRHDRLGAVRVDPRRTRSPSTASRCAPRRRRRCRCPRCSCWDEPSLAVCAPDKLRGALDHRRSRGAGGRRRAGGGLGGDRASAGRRRRGHADVLLAPGRAARRGRRHRRAGPAVSGPRSCCSPTAPRWSRPPRPSGSAHLDAAERDPLPATSAGAAALVRAALDAGAPRIVLCLGGSATVDGGLGLLAGLGARVLDGDGSPLDGTGADLDRVAVAHRAGPRRAAGRVELVVAADVTSPLTGPQGAARVFGPQKGASRARCGASTRAWCARRASRPVRGRSTGPARRAGSGAACAWLGADVVPAPTS